MAATVERPAAANPKARTSFYRGGEGMFTWVLHRVTGVAIFSFLFAHVLDTSLVRVSPALYDGVIEVYHHPVIKLMELGLVIAVLYHATNGIRVTLIDFWSKGAARNRMMMRVQHVIFAVLAIGASVAMLTQLVTDL
ncbi:succinate dehydrogenase, cytochrome b556 subunit [soil metagenome]|jgi:succinate dehydrogenase / fumarate reductase cytochrome b subunit|nr:succinate dehydrogenase, cytochrome b556 subunit [Euzebyaceae bacterium]